MREGDTGSTRYSATTYYLLPSAILEGPRSSKVLDFRDFGE